MQIRLVFTDNLDSYKNTQPITILKTFLPSGKIMGKSSKKGCGWRIN
jgi:hypothetical protein